MVQPARASDICTVLKLLLSFIVAYDMMICDHDQYRSDWCTSLIIDLINVTRNHLRLTYSRQDNDLFIISVFTWKKHNRDLTVIWSHNICKDKQHNDGADTGIRQVVGHIQTLIQASSYNT